MYSWRARIGVIAPMNDQIEYAFNQYAPEGVAFNCVKMPFSDKDPAQADEFAGKLEKVAPMFSGDRHDAVLFGFNIGARTKGSEFDKQCAALVETGSGSPALTSSMAAVEALRALGAKKVVVMTPYGEEENKAEATFLEENGFEVLSVTGIGYNDQFLYSTADKRHLYRNARDIDMSGADAFYVSSMHFETLELVHVYEEDFGLPAVTSHQAALWAVLRRAGINDKIPYLGKLFTL
ncbi:MAG: arylmalonate decarboxylase [Oscillospiraceae bacterium]|nr:arylmalonate decarboxylase [Oscillospiraceae bacterium]